MNESIGKKRWAIPEGYIPPYSQADNKDLISHEAICILNACQQPAHVCLTIYFADREPVGPYKFDIPARRTKHIKLNDLNEPEPIPKDTPFSSTIESDVPIVVQHTRIDTRQAANALMTTIAFASDD